MQFTDWFTEEAQKRNAEIDEALYGKTPDHNNADDNKKNTK